MNTKRTYSIFAVMTFCIIMCACGKTSDSNKSNNPRNQLKINKTREDEVNIVKFLSSDPKGYLNFYAATDYEFGIISSQANPLKAPSIYSYSRSMTANNDVSGVASSQSLRINNIEVNAALRTKSDVGENLSDVFGKKAKFCIGYKTKSGTYDENELYIPEIIEITSPKVTVENDLYPRCDANNFVVKWNKDLLNDNGVIIKIEWDGTVLFGRHRENCHIILADLFSDTGEATLPLEMFEGIPDTALCDITVLRGNVDALLVDDYSYKMGCASSETMSFILLRHIRQK